MDIIRLTSPSHIVRMVPDKRRVFNVVTDLLPFTPHTLTSTPGILTPSSSPIPVPWSTEEHWYSEHITGLSGKYTAMDIVSVVLLLHLISPLSLPPQLPSQLQFNGMCIGPRNEVVRRPLLTAAAMPNQAPKGTTERPNRPLRHHQEGTTGGPNRPLRPH